MKRVGIITVVTVCVVIILVAAKSGQTRVSGVVENSKGDPIKGVQVFAVRNGAVVVDTRTGQKGEYDFNVAGKRPFDLLFKDGAYDTSLLMELSPGYHHQIAKVLLAKDEILDPRSRIGKEFAKAYQESVDDPRVRRP